MMNPFLSVSDSGGIKGGAGDSLSPSLSRIKNKFSTQSQFSSQRVNIVAKKSEKPGLVNISQKDFSLSP